MGVLCASYLPEWDALPNEVALVNTGYVRVGGGGGWVGGGTFSAAWKVCDVSGGGVETTCVKVEEEMVRRERERERAERARQRWSPREIPDL